MTILTFPWPINHVILTIARVGRCYVNVYSKHTAIYKHIHSTRSGGDARYIYKWCVWWDSPLSGLCTCLACVHVCPVYMSDLCTCLTCVHVWPVYMSDLCTCLACVHVCPVYMSGLCTCLACVHVCPVYMSGLCTCLACVHVCHVYMSVLCTCLSCVHVCHVYMSVLCTCLSCVHVWPVYMSGLCTCLSCVHVCPVYMSVLCTYLACVHVWPVYMSGLCTCLSSCMTVITPPSTEQLLVITVISPLRLLIIAFSRLAYGVHLKQASARLLPPFHPGFCAAKSPVCHIILPVTVQL